MKILKRYVLKEHVGPFLFAVTALTSLMLLQYIARQFGNLVGKGIGWEVILEFFLLSIPFTVAMTLPMAVLVAVLYAYSRLGSENEITALKAGGVSTRSLMHTTLLAAGVLGIGMVLFNDQIMPWANHRLATLQLNIAVTKPTFALREQVINEVQPERLFLRAAKIDEATSKLYDVTIDDISDPSRRRTIIADSGHIALAPNYRDVVLTLNNGYVVSMPTQKRGELDRLYFAVQMIRMRDVAGQFKQTSADSTMKGNREMSVCEMQHEYEKAAADYQRSSAALAQAVWLAGGSKGKEPPIATPRKIGGIGEQYCRLYTWVTGLASRMGPKEAKAATIADLHPGVALQLSQQQQPAVNEPIEVTIQKAELEAARRRRDTYGVEIQKKFSLAAACVVLAFVGAPIALRFPRGGVGLVIGVSFGIFALYYVSLIGGESLANKGYLSPVWAMWGANIIFSLIGLVLYARMGHEAGSARGEGLREWFHTLRLRMQGRSPLDTVNG